MARKEVAQCIGAVLGHNSKRVNHVADGFAHFLPAARDESVIDDLLGGREPGREQHRLPHNRLKAHLVFAGKL